MKKSYILTSFILILCLIFSGCSDDEDTFKGTDKYFISFTLTADGLVYPAEIKGDEIIVNVPAGTNLSGAKPNYKISENADVVPAPESIEDWYSEHIFRLEAHNKEFTSYTYTINVTDTKSENDVFLLTQSDVDKFSESGINYIAGNLVIGKSVNPSEEYDTIRNLDGLRNIKEVQYNVVINKTYAGSNLDGLFNLKKAGGLYMGSAESPSHPSGRINVNLPALEFAGNISLCSDSITEVSLPVMTVASNIAVSSMNMNTLNLNSLEHCSGDVTIKGLISGSPTSSNTNAVIKKLSLPQLTTVGNNLTIDNFWGAQELELPLLKTVEGNCTISYVRTAKSISFTALQKTGGDFVMKANDGMVSFAAPKLQSTASLYIASLNIYSINLQSIELPLIERVNGDITINYAAVENLELPGLKEVSGNVELASMYFIASLELPLLQKCNSLELAALSMMNDCNISSLRECKSLKLSGLKLLETYDASSIENLEDVTIENCALLTDVKMPNTLKGDLSFSSSSEEIGFLPFEGLEIVEGQLKIAGFSSGNLIVENIKEAGELYVNYNSDIERIELGNLEKAGKFTLNNLQNITELSAPKFISCSTFSVKGCSKMTNINLPEFTTVEGEFIFYGGTSSWNAKNSIITNLDGFAALQTAGSVEIKYAANLSDFSAMATVANNMETDWTVSGCAYNPSLEDMKNGNYTN